MCGINGVFRFDGEAVGREELEVMNNLMAHRGPDDEGYYLKDNIGLAMRRLAIIDLEGGHQPIFNENNRYCVVLNGEIFNYKELREELQEKGHRFRTNSDTEVFPHLYEDYGEECLKFLNGMFVFALWDSLKKELFLARDRLGVKSLYYLYSPKYFAFASELKSIIKILPFSKEVDEKSFLMYLLLLYVPSPKSIIKNVLKLEPACYLKIKNNGNIEKKQYWDVTKFNTFVDPKEEDCQEKLLAMLRDSVSLQMRSDVPLGTFLSGGIDSSCVVSLLASQVDEPVRTFSVGYEGHHIDERPYARIVAERFNTDHSELWLRAEDVVKQLPRIVWYMDEPLADSAMIPTFLLSEMAREKGVKVILNGTGGDEIFGGYTRYAPNKWERQLVNNMPMAWRKLLAGVLRLGGITSAWRMQDPMLDHFLQISGVFPLLAQLMSSKVSMNKLVSEMHICFDNLCNGTDWYKRPDKQMYFDLKTYLAGDLLQLLDKMTMGASIEGRVPLLDHRLVELMFSLPERYKVNNGETKYLIKRALKNNLPDDVLFRRKEGFGGPVDNWITCNMIENLPELTQDKSSSFLKEYLNMDWSEISRRIPAFKGCGLQLLFSLIVFDLWYKIVFEGESPNAPNDR